ncbi:HDIG domain-containing protein [Olivibacter sp. SDN3]|uniref:HD family phosphohydrolase n=1 Tax=Olivibacter sp. SDN3 TaxID=2764720 RepID=UPI001650D847|nr:HDIG domain-containing metalloprotein [Olivibacter sp. SDN3]QNL52529.1 HDIG domain-containing protein [Olivibacter sp. SDN3]
MLLSVIIICIFLPKQPRFRFEYEKGKIWMHEDLIAPYNFAILKTPAEIKADREQVLRAVYPVYDNHIAMRNEETERFLNELENKWKGSGLEDKEMSVYSLMVTQILSHVYNRGIIALTKKFQIDGEHYTFNLVTESVTERKNTAEVYTRETALAYANTIIDDRKAVTEKEWLKSIVGDYIQPNYIYNERLTDKLEADALASISTTRGMVQRGELIVASGSMVNNEVFQKVESLRVAYEEEARIGGDRKVVVVGQFLIVGLVVTLLMVFLYLFRIDVFSNNRLLSLILLVVTGMLVVLSWALKLQLSSLYYIPFCIVPIIIRILFDTRMALNIHLLMVLVSGFFVPNSFEFAFLQVTAGMVSIYSIKTLIKREQFLLSSLIILITYFIAYLGIILIRDGSIADIGYTSFVPFVVSVLLTLLAYPLIYAFERLFGITSDVSLMELTNTNSSLLRELSYKAPGTFQHSLQVANLAEAAIYKIGGNALLVRAGALYHDIGKMQNPQYFIENQTKGYNPHDGLTFEQSAQIIIAHVNKGIDLAHKHQLPESIINFIRTHHGTTRTDFFYNAFIKEFPEKIVDEQEFRYPGPIPFSKETAVLMMADSVEAASRSIKEPDAENISNLVDKIIEGKLAQGQFKNSNITMQEIETIRAIFKRMLMSIYHVRVDYDAKKTKASN